MNTGPSPRRYLLWPEAAGVDSWKPQLNHIEDGADRGAIELKASGYGLDVHDWLGIDVMFA